MSVSREEVRKNHSKAMIKMYAGMTKEQRQEKRNKLKETWAQPENRKKILEISRKGLEAANSPEGRKNFNKANQSEPLRKKRSEIAKNNTHKRMLSKKKYSELNIFFEQKMNNIGLYPIREYPLGPYCVDFCFPENKLVIEADGDFWHANPEFLKERNSSKLYPFQKKTIAIDKAKNTYLKNHGWKLLRFWERDIKKDYEKCLLKIKEYLEQDK